MNQFSKKQLALFIALILVGGTVFLFSRDADVAVQKATVFEFETEVNSAQMILGEGYQTFTHPTFAFSVEYPNTFVIEAYKEKDGGETIIFQTQDEKKLGFQIFISPFGEDEVITRERILEDIPFTTVLEPQEVIIGNPSVNSGQVIHALVFWSEDPSVGKTREVWFTYGGNLYEITTYAELDSWLAQILSSWRFVTE